MVVYLGLFGILVLLAILEFLFQNKKVSILTGLVLALFAGFRFYTGFDYVSYGNFYQQLNSFGDVFNRTIDAESGYLFLTYSFKLFGLNYPTFILFFSFLSIGLLWFYLYRHTQFPSIVLVYYFARFYIPRDMGQIRGSIASIILLYAIPYMREKNLKKFLLVVFIASLFHISALVFILAYVVLHFFETITIKQSAIVLSIGLLIGWVANQPHLYTWAIPGRYVAYFTAPNYTNGDWLMNPVLWMQLMVFFGSLIFTNIQDDKIHRTHLVLYLLSSFILISGGNLATIGGRLSAPFTTQEIFVVPYFILNFTRNKLLNVIFFFGFTVVIFLLIFVISGTYQHYIPYQSVFNLLL